MGWNRRYPVTASNRPFDGLRSPGVKSYLRRTVSAVWIRYSRYPVSSVSRIPGILRRGRQRLVRIEIGVGTIILRGCWALRAIVSNYRRSANSCSLRNAGCTVRSSRESLKKFHRTPRSRKHRGPTRQGASRGGWGTVVDFSSRCKVLFVRFFALVFIWTRTCTIIKRQA